jgi:D-alanine transaminase
MKTLGYYNGTWGPLDEMTVPMNDRASWFGDGVYDAGPARNYHMFAMDEHIDRFFRSAAALEIEVPVTKADLADLLCDLRRKMDTGDLLVYFQVTRGTAPRSHAFCDGPANLWVTLVPYEIDEGRTPVKLVSAEDTRFFHCNVKTLNLIPSVMAAEAAKRAGAYETVLYRPGERVTECAHSNVHIIEDGAFVTAPADNLILPGIGRAHLIAACGRLGIPVREEPYTLDRLRAADEVIVSSSGTPCLRACELDGAPVGGKAGELVESLRASVVNELLIATE